MRQSKPFEDFSAFYVSMALLAFQLLIPFAGWAPIKAGDRPPKKHVWQAPWLKLGGSRLKGAYKEEEASRPPHPWIHQPFNCEIGRVVPLHKHFSSQALVDLTQHRSSIWEQLALGWDKRAKCVTWCAASMPRTPS